MFQYVRQEFIVRGVDLSRKVMEIVREGNATRIIIKDSKGVRFAEIPCTLGVLSVLLIPALTVVGALSALVADFRITVERIEPVNAKPPKRSGVKQVLG